MLSNNNEPSHTYDEYKLSEIELNSRKMCGDSSNDYRIQQIKCSTSSIFRQRNCYRNGGLPNQVIASTGYLRQNAGLCGDDMHLSETTAGVLGFIRLIIITQNHISHRIPMSCGVGCCFCA